MTVRLQGDCLQKEIVYQATVTISEKKETYVGLTATGFKQEGKMSLKHEKKRNDTEPNKFLRELKEKKELFTMSWKILAKTRVYSNLSSKQCHLCLEQKYFIISNPQIATLNKRNELVSTCTHRRKCILKYNLGWHKPYTVNKIPINYFQEQIT